RVPAPRAGPRRPGERAGPVPEAGALRGERQLEAEVQAFEEPRRGTDELVVEERDPRERGDPMAPDAVAAPVSQHVELDGAFLSRGGIDDLHAVERRLHVLVRDLVGRT